jgi:L-ascorbate metabolism protein UlaG (beta-lactamase superfamily)
MEIIYLGHSAFKLKGKTATLVTDPYEKKLVGFAMPKVSADIVTVSHQHEDHNAASRVGGTARRQKPYLIEAPGEYEVNGIGVFGWGSFHDASQGKDRGKNTMYSIMIDGINVCHLGDLGHTLDDDQIQGLGIVDVLLIPVGGFYTIGPDKAAEVIQQLQPTWVIPMHYKTMAHDTQAFEKVLGLEAFLKEMGEEATIEKEKLVIKAGDTREETEIVVLKRMGEEA